MKNRILSLLLVVFLCFGLLPLMQGQSEASFSKEELLQIWDWLIPTMIEENILPLELNNMRRGDKGEQVIMLQARLRQLGYYSKALDGSFGVGTQSAWKTFEQVHGLRVDGIASIEEQLLLYSASAIAQDVPVRSSKTKKPSATPTPAKTRRPSWIDREINKAGDVATLTPSPSPTPKLTPKKTPSYGDFGNLFTPTYQPPASHWWQP